MKRAGQILLFISLSLSVNLMAANNQVLGWNNLGMHCMDSDYSVFSILPPYNTIEAQLIVGGKLITNATGYSVTYQAVTDPDGSVNTTSAGKGNWRQFAPLLYGAVAVDQGLPFPGPDSFWMPGTNNTPQGMGFESSFNWFVAYGVPITPYDDAGKKNPYPMMRIIAHVGGTPVATNDVVLPVSDEMDCRACHASGTQADAQPAAGWVWAADPERDFRLNILRRHDEDNFAHHHDLYVSALAARGFNPQGLYRGVVADGQPVLCAACHASEALATQSYSNIPPLTVSVHSKHAAVADPDLHITLDDSANRAACYRCHPGSTTRCLRGAMGAAVAADGSMAMQCQSCHGNMSQVGSSTRTGWLNEPTCQSCHTGTATSNNGQIRYLSSFTDTNWTVRRAANQTFATKSNSPAPGLSLYRFSAGHGGLQCSACHGSTHAEFPASHRNDNLRNIGIQGHVGVMSECTACHTSSPTTRTGGPHGMHPVGPAWVKAHHSGIDESSNPPAQCQVCHGATGHGTVLSRALGSRTLTAEFDNGTVTLNLFRGAEVGCYNCHNGAGNGETANTSPAPTVTNVSTNTTSDQALAFVLPATGSGINLRIITQPEHGSVGLNGHVATYFPEPGFVGSSSFTFAAWDGSKNSSLATGTVAVAQGPFGITAKALVPPSYPAAWAAPFGIHATPVNVSSAPTFDWDFGDGVHSSSQYATHTYSAPGSYNWSVISRVQSGAMRASVTNTGTILIQAPATLSSVASSGGSITLSWPNHSGDALLEETADLTSGRWFATTNQVSSGSGGVQVHVPATPGAKFYRLRQL